MDRAGGGKVAAAQEEKVEKRHDIADVQNSAVVGVHGIEALRLAFTAEEIERTEDDVGDVDSAVPVRIAPQKSAGDSRREGNHLDGEAPHSVRSVWKR